MTDPYTGGAEDADNIPVSISFLGSVVHLRLSDVWINSPPVRVIQRSCTCSMDKRSKNVKLTETQSRTGGNRVPFKIKA